jgi:thiamine biosynthesis lipoprotein ApbE
MRRIDGVNAEIRAIGLTHPHEPALGAAFAAVTRLDGASADRAAASLRSAGARKGLVNLGGDHLVVFGEPLVVAVPDPGDVTAPRWASFSLADGALARRGSPGGAAAVTVVAGTAAEAADVAAAAVALTPDEALALVARRGAAGVLQTHEGERHVLRATPGFAAARDLRAEAGVELRP